MRRKFRSWARFSLVAFLLVGTLALLNARTRGELVPPHKSLLAFPTALAGWQGQDLPLAPAIVESLGPGEFLFRNFSGPLRQDRINLFIAFFPSQRAGDTIHSPKNCLPGAGWKPVESAHLFVESPGKRPSAVNRYIVEKGLDRAFVLYWYQAHGRTTPSEYWAKFYLVSDAIRMNRSDGALVRVVTVLQNGESPEVAERRAVGFAQRIIPILDEYIPR
jgi:EpsI family protein